MIRRPSGSSRGDKGDDEQQFSLRLALFLLEDRRWRLRPGSLAELESVGIFGETQRQVNTCHKNCEGGDEQQDEEGRWMHLCTLHTSGDCLTH